MANKEKIHLMDDRFSGAVLDDDVIDDVVKDGLQATTTFCGLTAISFSGAEIRLGVPAVLEQDRSIVTCERCNLAYKMREFMRTR